MADELNGVAYWDGQQVYQAALSEKQQWVPQGQALALLQQAAQHWAQTELEGNAFIQGCTITAARPPTSLTFYNDRNEIAVVIHFDPPRVEVNTGMDWDGAAKLFWNSVARCVGQKAPFGW